LLVRRLGCGVRELASLLAGSRIPILRTPSLGRAPTSAAANFSHVPAIQAHLFAAFAARSPGLIGREFMSFSLFMSRAAAFAGDFTLTVHIH